MRITGITDRSALRYAVLVSCLAILLVLATLGIADDCFQYGQQVRIRGQLTMHDENGYRQWIALNPERPICVVDRPVAELQTISSGAEGLERLRRLVGNTVVVHGMLMAAATIDVADVEPVDAAGRDALTKQVVLEDVAAYDVVMVAGPRLTKEVRRVGTGRLLMPADAYAPHEMSASDVLYTKCPEGYDMESGTIMPPDVGLCVAGICGFPVEAKQVKVLKMRCVRASAKK